MANAISCGRIVLSVALLFFPTLSPSFYALYLCAGLTDMLDGAVARKTGSASAFGARLDTAADFVFVAICLIKFLPVMEVPVWLYGWITVIAAIKGINAVSGYGAVHTVTNKVTGAVLFAFPLTFSFIDLKYSAVVACAVATFAAVQEGNFIRRPPHE